MGILSFFEQIGSLIVSLVDAIVFVITTLVRFIGMIVTGFTYVNIFAAYIPGELAATFVVLVCLAVIYLIVGR